MRVLRGAISVLVSILVPLALIFLGVRLLLTRAFLHIEYHLPNFPVDTYGFTLEERYQWSVYALDYLLNDADIEYLGELTFSDGTALFSTRELSHMQDVKNVIQPVLWIGYGSWIFLSGAGLWARYRREWAVYRRALRAGGWLVLGMALAAGIFALTSFWQFFSVFHSLFFSGDSWIFLYSDTLIRLFPMRFWQDAFIFTGVVTIGGGLALVVGLGRKKGAE